VAEGERGRAGGGTRGGEGGACSRTAFSRMSTTDLFMGRENSASAQQQQTVARWRDSPQPGGLTGARVRYGRAPEVVEFVLDVVHEVLEAGLFAGQLALREWDKSGIMATRGSPGRGAPGIAHSMRAAQGGAAGMVGSGEGRGSGP
jgi:hypothetical protein